MRIDAEGRLTVPQARELAVRAHGDQRDRDGNYHIAHVARVADLAGSSAAYQRVAWLHDVIEDTDIDSQELRKRLPGAEWDALCLLTHDEADSYEQYIEAIARADGEAGALARAVKESDLLDNVRRCCAARDHAVGKYGAALARLWASAGSRAVDSPAVDVRSPRPSDEPRSR